MARCRNRTLWAAISWTLLRAAAVHADEEAQQPIPIWNGVPPGTAANAPAEQLRLTEAGEHIVSSVHRPSLSPYLPDPALATGAAVIVIPGGGHRELWMDHEGYRVAQWLSARGIAAFVLKYRLAAETGSHYSVEGDELADVQRAIRLVRHRAGEWHVDPSRVGVLGFSAGGELALLAATKPQTGAMEPADDVARESALPAFAGLIYPGGESATPALRVAPPPIFLLCGEQDLAIAARMPPLQAAIEKAGGSTELHILAHANHGFGLREGNPPAIAIWPTLFYNWLDSSGFLKVAAAAAPALSEPMRSAFPGAVPIAPFDARQIAKILQETLPDLSTPAVGMPQLVSPNAPQSADGMRLSFWKPAFLLGTSTGGEAGINFWNLYNEGHVNVGFRREAGVPLLLDCRMYSSGNVAYKVYSGEKGALTGHGELDIRNGHALLPLPAQGRAESVSVELWPNPSHALLGFFGCARWPYSLTASPVRH